ncbi:MAG: MFS transporter [Oscillospiraceae bacterium]|nr:MFS transporter [Oscillospiraceae bacterium]
MKLNTKRTVLIGLAFMSVLAFWQFYDQMIPVILENHFGRSTMITNAIMSIDNILAVFMLPLFGMISDKTQSRLGKRTPYILFGTVAAVALMLVMCFLTEANNFAGFFICLMLLLVTMSIYRSPTAAYMPDVTPKPLRSKGNAIINLVGYVGGIFSTIIMMFIVTSTEGDDGKLVYGSFIPIFTVVAAFMLIAVLIMVFTVNENKVVAETAHEMVEEETVSAASVQKLPKEVKKSLIFILLSVFLWFTAYNGVTTSFSRYFENKFHVDAGDSSLYLTVATIVAIISFIPLGTVSSKLGRKKTIIFGVVLMTVCYAVMFFLTEVSVLMYIIFGLVGIGWAAINVNSFPMVVEMCTGSDVGKFTGYYYAFSMSAQIVTPFLSALVISKTNVFGLNIGLGLGYDALFPYAVVFSALAILTMIFVCHGDSKPQAKKSVLENFDVDD